MVGVVFFNKSSKKKNFLTIKTVGSVWPFHCFGKLAIWSICAGQRLKVILSPQNLFSKNRPNQFIAF